MCRAEKYKHERPVGQIQHTLLTLKIARVLPSKLISNNLPVGLLTKADPRKIATLIFTRA
ncbi:MAG: hypothetical protein ACJA0E_001054 [Bermanella sp.]|jgi:hypothetical protein